MSDREPIVLVPAMLTDAELWAAQVDALAADAPVHVHELTLAESIAAQAADVLHAAPRRFALAGLSLGAMVAMEVVRVAPDRVTRLALLDTNPRAPTEAQRVAWRSFALRAAEAGVRRLVRDSLLDVLVSPSRRDRLAERVLAMAERVGLRRFQAQLRVQASRIDMRPLLGAVRCPTLVATGRDDTLCPPAMHDELAAAIPGARLAIIDDCGHLSTLEQPMEVSELLSDWMTWRAA
jgi:pimeloyl-ACP methyl ester carboxylesterase